MVFSVGRASRFTGTFARERIRFQEPHKSNMQAGESDSKSPKVYKGENQIPRAPKYARERIIFQ